MEGKLQVWITIMKSWALEEIWPAEQKRILVLIPNWKRPSLAADNKAQINGKIQSQCLYWTNSFTVFLRYSFPNVKHTISRQKIAKFSSHFCTRFQSFRWWTKLDCYSSKKVCLMLHQMAMQLRCKNLLFPNKLSKRESFFVIVTSNWRADEHGWRNGNSGRHPPMWLLWSSCSELGEVNDTLLPWYIHSVRSLIVSLFGRFIIRTNVR